jgi:hypothetical protein
MSHQAGEGEPAVFVREEQPRLAAKNMPCHRARQIEIVALLAIGAVVGSALMRGEPAPKASTTGEITFCRAIN